MPYYNPPRSRSNHQLPHALLWTDTVAIASPIKSIHYVIKTYINNDTALNTNSRADNGRELKHTSTVSRFAQLSSVPNHGFACQSGSYHHKWHAVPRSCGRSDPIASSIEMPMRFTGLFNGWKNWKYAVDARKHGCALCMKSQRAQESTTTLAW